MDIANNQLIDSKIEETALNYILDILEDKENIKNGNNEGAGRRYGKH